MKKNTSSLFLLYLLLIVYLPVYADIIVKQGNTTIPVGGSFNFGINPVGTSKILTFSIINEPITIFPRSLSGLILPPGFSLVGSFPGSVSSEVSFDVRLDAINIGGFGGILRFTIGANEIYDFTIIGTVISVVPDIRFFYFSEEFSNNTGIIDLGAIQLGEAKSFYIVPQSDSYELLQIGIPDLPEGLSLLGGNFQYSYGVLGSIQFKFEPKSVGDYSAVISLLNNDPNENPFNITVQATVLQPEFTVATLDAPVAGTINIPINVKNFENIAGFQFQIKFPSGKFSFLGLENFNPSLTGLGTDSYHSAGNVLVNVLWYHPGNQNISLPQNELLFTIKLKVNTDKEENLAVCLQNLILFDNIPAEIAASSKCGVISTIITFVISGKIHTADNQTVKNADVFLKNLTQDSEQSFNTLNDGLFSFNARKGQDFDLSVIKNINLSNGISIADLVLLNRHILGSDLLESPYKIIAADLNNSKSVNVADMILLNQLVLGLISMLPDNTSWRFVKQSYTFPNPLNPFAEIFPEVIHYSNLQSDKSNQNFRAIKIGDLNHNRNAQFKPQGSLITLSSPEQHIAEGEVLRVPIKAQNNYDELIAWQGTFSFDTEVLSYEGFEKKNLEVKADNFNLNESAKGFIPFAYFDWRDKADSFTENTVLFELIFSVKGKEGTETKIEFNESKISNFAYDKDLGEYPIEWNAGIIHIDKLTPLESMFELNNQVKIFPNPTTENFKLELSFNQARNVNFILFDKLGKAHKNTALRLKEGKNTLDFETNGLAGGIYFLHIETEGIKAVKKVILR